MSRARPERFKPRRAQPADRFRDAAKRLTVETGKIIRWGYLVKKHGILTLEREIKSAKSQDAYMRYGVELVITGYSGDEVRQMLANAAAGQYQRAMVEADILKNMAAAAPAFGMVSTLIGLIVMLSALGGDASAMGQGWRRCPGRC